MEPQRDRERGGVVFEEDVVFGAGGLSGIKGRAECLKAVSSKS